MPVLVVITLVMSSDHRQNNPENNFKKIGTCPVCLGYFKQPKQLPNCSHTFCLECLQRVPKQEWPRQGFNCPVCRTFHRIERGGLDALPANFVAQQMAETLEAQDSGIFIRRGSGIRSPPPARTLNSRAKIERCKHTYEDNRKWCPHCNSKFCRSCEIGHKETLKVELDGIYTSWAKSRRHSDQSQLRKVGRIYEQAEQTSRRELNMLENKLETTVQTLKENFSAVLDEKAQKILKEAREVHRGKLSRTERAFQLISGSDRREVERVDNFLKQSVLNYDLADVANLHKRIAAADNKLKRGDSLVDKFKMDFRVDRNIETLLDGIDQVSIGRVTYMDH